VTYSHIMIIVAQSRDFVVVACVYACVCVCFVLDFGGVVLCGEGERMEFFSV